MAKTDRDFLLRKYDQFVGDIDRQLEKLAAMKDTYAKYGTDYNHMIAFIDATAQGLIILREEWRNFRQNAM